MGGEGEGAHTEVQGEQVAAHAIVQSRIVYHECPFNLGRDLGCAAKRLQCLLPELGVEDDQGRVVREEEFGLEVGRLRTFKKSVDRRLWMLASGDLHT